MINTADEDGNYVDLGGEFPLEENEHFNKLPVNTQMSNIQVPTNVYNKGQRCFLPDSLNIGHGSLKESSKSACFSSVCRS